MHVLTDGPTDDAPCLILAHGAGAPMDTPFMTYFAEGVAKAGIGVLRFEFPYMAARREDGKKRPPDRAPKLLDAFAQVLEAASAGKVFTGGKSMGGRMASMLAAQRPVDGVICLGYPFHPPGKPDRLRVEHFPDISAPVLICQGERDTFGKREEIDEMTFPSGFKLHWCADGDHDLKPRKVSGRTAEQNWQEAVNAIVAFINGAA